MYRPLLFLCLHNQISNRYQSHILCDYTGLLDLAEVGAANIEHDPVSARVRRASRISYYESHGSQLVRNPVPSFYISHTRERADPCPDREFSDNANLIFFRPKS
jgi:hypothetical protein